MLISKLFTSQGEFSDILKTICGSLLTIEILENYFSQKYFMFTCTSSSSEPMRRSRWVTTPDWCIVTQFQGSWHTNIIHWSLETFFNTLDSWWRAAAVVLWTSRSEDVRYETRGATAPAFPNNALLVSSSQQLLIAWNIIINITTIISIIIDHTSASFALNRSSLVWANLASLWMTPWSVITARFSLSLIGRY